MKTIVRIEFDFSGNPEEAKEFIKSEVPYWGSDAIAPFLEGKERYFIGEEEIHISKPEEAPKEDCN